MALSEDECNDLLCVIAGALANLDVKIRCLESVQPLPKKDLEIAKRQFREQWFTTLQHQFLRTLKASHQQKTHPEMDRQWMEQQMDPSDDPSDDQ